MTFDNTDDFFNEINQEPVFLNIIPYSQFHQYSIENNTKIGNPAEYRKNPICNVRIRKLDHIDKEVFKDIRIMKDIGSYISKLNLNINVKLVYAYYKQLLKRTSKRLSSVEYVSAVAIYFYARKKGIFLNNKTFFSEGNILEYKFWKYATRYCHKEIREMRFDDFRMNYVFNAFQGLSNYIINPDAVRDFIENHWIIFKFRKDSLIIGALFKHYTTKILREISELVGISNAPITNLEKKIRGMHLD